MSADSVIRVGWMSLSSAFGIAQSSLTNSAAQSALLSRNIANVNNSDYSRRTASSVTLIGGGVAQGSTQRATSAALLARLFDAQASSTAQQAISDGLTQLAQSLGLDVASSSSTTAATDTSPATAIGALATALQQYAASPDNATYATAAVQAAKSLAANLNSASASVQQVRQQADTDIAASVQTINGLLAQFQTANQAVVAGTNTGADVSDALDARDGILKQLSQEIGITTAQGASGSMSIYTDSGATLFETSARTVGFTTTNSLAAGKTGQAVTVDGVAVTGSSSVMPIKSGRIAGLTSLRDDATVSYENQLDQIASGLVAAFAESDQTGGSAPTLPGLFTSDSLTGLPTSARTTGLAASIKVNANVDPSAGGVVTRLRDGNIAGSSSAYTYNTTGAASFSARLQALGTALGATRSFDASTGGAASGSLSAYATSSVSWIESQRQAATDSATTKSAVASTATTALSNATGVNLDDEMSRMLDIEHAYQASAQLLNTINSMFTTLIQSFN